MLNFKNNYLNYQFYAHGSWPPEIFIEINYAALFFIYFLFFKKKMLEHMRVYK